MTITDDDYQFELYKARLTATANFVQSVLRTAIILHGGALIAVIAFFGKVGMGAGNAVDIEFKIGVALYVVGIVLTAILQFCGYKLQYNLLILRARRGEPYGFKKIRKRIFSGVVTSYLIFGVASLVIVYSL